MRQSVRDVTAHARSARGLDLSTVPSAQLASSSIWKKAAAYPAAVTLTQQTSQSAVTAMKHKV